MYFSLVRCARSLVTTFAGVLVHDLTSISALSIVEGSVALFLDPADRSPSR